MFFWHLSLLPGKENTDALQSQQWLSALEVCKWSCVWSKRPDLRDRSRLTFRSTTSHVTNTEDHGDPSPRKYLGPSAGKLLELWASVCHLLSTCDGVVRKQIRVLVVGSVYVKQAEERCLSLTSSKWVCLLCSGVSLPCALFAIVTSLLILSFPSHISSFLPGWQTAQE